MWNGSKSRLLSHLAQLFIWREISKVKMNSKVFKSHLWKDIIPYQLNSSLNSNQGMVLYRKKNQAGS